METRDHAFHINQLYTTDRDLKDVRFYPLHYRPLPFFGDDGDTVTHFVLSAVLLLLVSGVLVVIPVARGTRLSLAVAAQLAN